MKKIVKTAGTALVAGSMLLFPLSHAAWSAAVPTSATAAQEQALQPFAGTKLKTFLISANSYVQVKDIFFQYDSNSKKVFFTLLVYNGDKQAIDFTYYYPEVFAASGGKFTVQEHPGNKKSGIVEPSTTEEFVYYANINPSLNYTDLVFKVQKIDFSMPGYTRLIGQAAVTASYLNSVPSKHYYIIRKGNDKLKTYLHPGSRLAVSGDNQIRLQYEMENVGWMTYTAPNLQFYVLTKAGHMVKLTPDMANQPQIQPGEKVVVTLSGAIKSSIDLDGTKLLVQAAPGGDQGIETPVAMYNLVWDTTSSFITGENQKARLKVSDMDVEAGIETLYVDKTETQNEWTVTVKWTNNGNSAVTLPKYKYELMDSRGVRYPMDVQESDIQIIPGIDKEIIGSAVTPPTVNGPFTLLVRNPKEEDSNAAEYVAAAFRLNPEQATGPVEGKRYRNEFGLYQIGVSRVERLPWGDQDLINAYVDIENLGSTSQIIPQIQAALKLNGINVDEQDVSVMKLEDKIMLGANEKTSYVVSTKVPYTYEFNELTLNLLEQTSGGAKSTIGLFKADEISPARSAGIKHTIDSVGRRASLEFLNTYMFEGKDDDLLYTEFKYTNEESRSKTLPVLKAYFKTSDGAYIEADIENVKSQLKTKGNAHLAAMAVVPKTFVSDGNVELIVGEAVQNGQYAGPDGSADGFIRAVSFKLPKNQNVAKEEFIDLSFRPYKLTIHNAFAVLSDSSNVRLDVRYSLSKTAEFNVMETGRKLYVELTGNNLKYGKTIEVEPKQGDGFEVGTEREIRIEIQGQNTGSLIYDGYTLNIYEEIDGYKRLLGSKRYYSFQIPS